MQKNKLLLLTSWFPIQEKPQSGIFFQQQANLLANKYDVKVVVCISNPIGRKGFIKSFVNKPKPQFQFIKSNLYEVIDFNIPEFVFINEENRYNLLFKNFVQKLQNLFTIWKPDIIHAHDAWFAGVIANKISEQTKIPYVLTNHTPLFINTNSNYINKNILVSIEKANQLTTVGNQDKRVFESILHLKNKAITIGNLIDTNLFSPINKNKAKKDSFKIVQVTSTSLRKDIPTFLNAIKQYIDHYLQNKKLEVVLIASQINDGYSIDELNADISKLKLNSVINLKKNMTNSDVAHELATADLYISTSYYETFGVSVAEAIAMGVPTIAVDNGAVRDFVTENKNGIIVNTGDFIALANAINKVANYEIAFNEEEMHQSIAAKYSSKVFLNTLQTIYTNVLHQA